MYLSPERVREIGFLASGTITSFTEYVDDTIDGVKNIRGRKIVPAGTVYPANNATAKGITINPVDVTNNATPVGVIVEGYMFARKLPVKPTVEAMESMSGIRWRDQNN